MFIETKQIFHWRRVFHKGRDFSCCKRLIAGVMMFTASAAVVAVGPTGEQVVGNGNATFARPDGNTTNITQTTPRVDINWTGFNTDVNHTVEFIQETGAQALAINRISGAKTTFDGTLKANGRIFLINQNGIIFGSTAQVNVGALLATTSDTLDVGDDGFGGFAEFTFNINNDGYAQIENHGSITVSDGGFAVLAAPYVKNSGFIKADLGHVELASGNNFTINVDMRGDGLITFAATPESLEDGFSSEDPLGVTNTSTGVLQSRSGHVYLTANIASDIVQSVVNLDGVVDADQFVSAPNGDLIMVASADLLLHYPGGTIKVDSVGDINIGMDGGADIHAVHAVFDEFDIRRPTPFNAEATFIAKRNISVGGAGNPVTITLKAISPGGGPVLIPQNSSTNATGSTADAEARLEMTAGSTTRAGKGKLTITNTAIEVTADASDTGPIFLGLSDLAPSYISHGDEAISAAATAVLQGPEVEINADINVHASADATGRVDGPVANSTDATATEYGYGVRPADALAVFDVFAIEFSDSGNVSFEGRGDLTMVGDINVSAISSTVNSANSKATANTMFAASGSTDVTGKINLDAIATSESGLVFDGFPGSISSSAEQITAAEYIEDESNSADANTALVLLGGTPQALIPLLKEISLNNVEPLGTLSDILTLANLYDVLEVASNIDPERLGNVGPGSVSYTGDSNINALADFSSTGGDELRTEGKAEATSAAYYVAGGDVFINTDPIKVDSQAYADYKDFDDYADIDSQADTEASVSLEVEESYVDTEARSFLVVAAGLEELFNDNDGDSDNQLHSEITVLGDLSTRAREQASLNGEPNPGEYNQLAAAVTALVATGDITVRGADPLAKADPAVAQGRTSRWQVCTMGTCDPVEEGVDGLAGLAEISAGDPAQEGPIAAARLAQIVIESLYGDIDIQSKDTAEDVQPAGLFTDPIGPAWPGDLPLRFDANGRMLVATGRDATKPPQIVALDSSIENALLSGGDPSVLLPPTAAGGCVAAGRDAFTISSPGYFERMISTSCETAE